MGKTIEKIAVQENIEIVCIIDKEVQEGDLSKADVSINFSIPSAAVKNILKSFEYKVPVVCGTTGWLDDFDLVKNYLFNNLKLNNNKLFKYYLKSFTSHNFNK